METPRSGMIGRIGERVLSWIALGLLLLLAWSIYNLPADTKIAVWNGIWKSLVWVALAAALPWTSRLLIRRVVEAGTNWAGAALVAALLTVEIVIGLLLMGGWPSGFWGWCAALAATAVAGTYNYLVAEYLAETSGG